MTQRFEINCCSVHIYIFCFNDGPFGLWLLSPAFFRPTLGRLIHFLNFITIPIIIFQVTTSLPLMGSVFEGADCRPWFCLGTFILLVVLSFQITPSPPPPPTPHFTAAVSTAFHQRPIGLWGSSYTSVKGSNNPHGLRKRKPCPPLTKKMKLLSSGNVNLTCTTLTTGWR